MVQVVWFKRDLRVEDHAALAADLRARGLGLTVQTGDAVDVFARLHRTHGVEAIHAHEEITRMRKPDCYGPMRATGVCDLGRSAWAFRCTSIAN